ncbi:HD-GYP domain-containing protein [Luteimonas terrae]|uniref:Nucleotidyltransferase with HDIG domain n=1 Tax=Luteimonas terrae TaxID=1530191 RepID=A0ABU1Y038_9GAMM|nr:HD-GYP domain-containing protein [Luteimonas terrae]MDR7193646.1 putative nucleotidyltransferase with HDIG domain [Luteimonas terrae]
MHRTIRADQLLPGMYVHRVAGAWLDSPFWRRSFIADAEAVARIRASGVPELVIDVELGLVPAESASSPPADPACPRKDVTAPPASPPDPSLLTAPAPAALRAAGTASPATSFETEVRNARQLLESGRALVEAMFGEARLGRVVDTDVATPLIDALCDSVLRNPHALVSLARLKTADAYTYLHSMAVAGLMATLAGRLGLPEDAVHAAAKGGLLHDMGKAVTPAHVLNKAGSLTDEEQGVMRSHPEDGHRLLVESGMDHAAALDIVLHHHEKMDGSGYPHGLSGDGISQMARMAAVCDVYDAITSDRPYKRGWCPAESLKRMASWSGHFDPVIFQAFVKSVGIYPIGTLVRLQSQQLAVVIEQAPAALLKPRVRVFHCARRKARVLIRDLDLSFAGCDDHIVQSEAPCDWGLRDLEKLWLP